MANRPDVVTRLYQILTMDKCLPVIDLFSNGQRDSGSVSEDVSSPIIWEDMSVFYLRQLASSLQVRAGVMKVPKIPGYP